MAVISKFDILMFREVELPRLRYVVCFQLIPSSLFSYLAHSFHPIAHQALWNNCLVFIKLLKMHRFCISVQKSLLAAVMFDFRHILQVCNEGLNAALKLNFGRLGCF